VRNLTNEKEIKFDETIAGEAFNLVNLVAPAIQANDGLRLYFFYHLLNLSVLDVAIVERAKNLDVAVKKAESAEKEKRERENAETKIEMEKPDSKLYILFNRRENFPNELREYVTKTPIEELEDYLTELKAKPNHYRDLFHDGFFEVIQILSQLIAEKKVKNAVETETQLPAAIKNQFKDLVETFKDVSDRVKSFKALISGKPETEYST